MARKRALKQFSDKELLEEIARRHADKHFREDMMSDIELAAEVRPVTNQPELRHRSNARAGNIPVR